MCYECGYSTSELTEPLIVEWDKGYEYISDMSWCGYCLLVNSRIKEKLERLCFKCKFGNVSLSNKSPKKLLKQYCESDLHWLFAESDISLLPRESSITVKSDCKSCDQLRHKFKADGLFIDGKEWDYQHLFTIKQFYPSDAMFVSEYGKEQIANLSSELNIKFTEAGSIVGLP